MILVFSKKKWKWVNKKLIGFSLFTFMVMYVDYLIIYYRDKGHFLMREDYIIQDYIGYFLSSFFLTMTIFELEKMLKNIKRSNDKNKKLADVYEDYYYGDISKKNLKKSWFLRNYQLLFLTRLFTLCLFLINAQSLKYLQIFGSLLLNISFLFITILLQKKYSLFRTKFFAFSFAFYEITIVIMNSIAGIMLINSSEKFLTNSWVIILSSIF